MKASLLSTAFVVEGGHVGEIPMSFVVIMAGGLGTRFWPRSRRAKPKQFLSLNGKNSLLRGTYTVATKIVGSEHVYVSTAREYANLVKKQIPEISNSRLILEPVGRDTGPSIALSCLVLSKIAEEGVVAFLPADHWISPRKAFIRTIQHAMEVAERSNNIITIGIPPTYPSTGYGYIHFGDPVLGEKARKVIGFKEKPDKNTATRYLTSKHYYWNSGILVSKIDVILNEISIHAPEIHNQVSQLKNVSGRRSEKELSRSFSKMPKVSIDYSVLEKTDNIATIPATFRWNDLGAWDSIALLLPTKTRGNYSIGSVLTIGSHGNIVMNEGKLTALIGVNDLVVIEDKDALLVCRKDEAQKVKQLVNILNEKGLRRYL